MKIFSEELVAKAVKELNIADLSGATIGEILLVAQYLEKETGIPFIRMDQGSPGLPVNHYGVEAEKAAPEAATSININEYREAAKAAKAAKTVTTTVTVTTQVVEA